MKVRIVYFAAARELAGCSIEELEYPADHALLSQFAHWLGERQPRLAPYLSRMRFAHNGEFATNDARLSDGDELTVMPPVAGGSMLAAVRDQPLSIDEVVAAVRHPSAGAIALFLGVVRDHHEGASVQRLDYEAYRELAEREMQRVLTALTTAYAGTRLAALHRVGELAIGDIAVIVAASSAHRAAAFDACRAAIDRIKETVPIWKKEWAADGSALWVNLERDERK
jgi:MoaE-MoaD fusion protein